MTSDSVTVISQPNQLHSNAASGSSSKEGKGYTAPNTVAELSGGSSSKTVDTVSISNYSRQSAADIKKNEDMSEDVRKKKTAADDSGVVGSGEKPGATAKVQFVYDLKGELSVRYLDKANNLIYQVPSELMLQMREVAMKSEASVDTKA